MTYDTFETLSTILLDAINIHWKFFLLISPYKISPESHIKDMSLKEMITNKKNALDYCTNSPCQHLEKCIENCKENLHTNVRV